MGFLFPGDQPQSGLPDDLFPLVARYYWCGELTAEDEAAAGDVEDAAAASVEEAALASTEEEIREAAAAYDAAEAAEDAAEAAEESE